MDRREFLRALAVGAASGLALDSKEALSAKGGIYDLLNFGNNVTLLHLTDCHAQLQPLYYREPSVNLGMGKDAGKLPHLVGEALLKSFNMQRGNRLSHAFSHLDFEHAARTFGKMGGFAHLAALVKKVREQRPGALLLDGGDSWQGSATALWTRGADMASASKLLGVDVMTGHWEFTLGAERVQELVTQELKGRIDFVAHNVKTGDFGDPVFPPYVIKEMNGVAIAIIGQAYPYTPVAHPRRLAPDWTFGIQEIELQKVVNEVEIKGVDLIVLLSHNGMDVDLKLASRILGIDVILGGHTHDAVPNPVLVKNHRGHTLVTNAGSHGKFLGVLDLQVKNRSVAGYQYSLLPVFSNLLPPDKPMDEAIRRIRAPFEKKLGERLATTEGLLYRRGNFTGTFDQVILDALMEVKDAEIAFSPGFRWGATLLPQQAITLEDVMNQTAISYPETVVTEMTGEAIKNFLEDVADNLFNPDPYYRQGGDMVRVGGLRYVFDPGAAMGRRVSGLSLRGQPLEAGKRYKVASWAPLAEGTKGEPVWDVVASYLKAKKVIRAPQPNQPRLAGVEGNPGLA